MEFEQFTGRFWDLKNYFVEARLFPGREMVLTFAPAGSDFKTQSQLGWATIPLIDSRISFLAIKPKSNNWYVHAELHSFVTNLKDSGFFDGYDKIVTYGGSMGGFGALMLANDCCATHVISINPQTTLNLQKVPWERRFGVAQEQDWTGPFTDVLDHFSEQARTMIVADRYHRPDAKHVRRLPQDRIEWYSVPFVGHRMPVHMQQLGLLKPMLLDVLFDRFKPEEFNAKARNRRKLQAYANGLLNHPKAKNRPSRQKMLSKLLGQELVDKN